MCLSAVRSCRSWGPSLSTCPSIVCPSVICTFLITVEGGALRGMGEAASGGCAISAPDAKTQTERRSVRIYERYHLHRGAAETPKNRKPKSERAKAAQGNREENRLMPEPSLNEILDFARALSAEAGQFILPLWKNAKVDHKADGSEVTEADRGAEELLRRRIAERYPDHTILGEEF